MKNNIIHLCIIILLSFGVFSVTQGESLQITETIEIPIQKLSTNNENLKLYIRNVYIEDSTIFISSNFGLLSLPLSEDTLIKLVELKPYGDNWWEDFEVAKKENALFSPGLIKSGKKQNEFIVFDSRINSFYTIDINNKKNIKTSIWKKDFSKYNLSNPSIYNDMILYFTFSDYTEKLVGISGYNLSDFQMIFDCPPKLTKMFDSLWTDPYCSPVFSPNDSTIWIAFDYYNYMYIIDFQGNLLDSVEIDSPDFKIPQPPLSRIKSNAVFQDWATKTTPVVTFNYIHPGYFLLQFITDKNETGNTTIGIYTTLLWDAKSKKLVKLDINKFWRVVGVQDERVIFKDYIKVNDTYKTVLYVTRIEP